ncbi:hypothetical protein TRIATDRAFT_301679 [Trichoderma atroviride IMI 206040]|uniref:Uncharacterized protein n=1 Tax=Hypocrea atroviridis (strain ATCC 20476 / IMI 206040) TaxID=452589 RepID=G9P8F8_HYPAI|nr:uncharacterized protein TRIATDRAFT_301679 [Trichoderma atroviride IMI 206040]EHK40951.1 hypothetical protein TRIATDRAFT_301679 [Trichoderma atroviride IMI 206040]
MGCVRSFLSVTLHNKGKTKKKKKIYDAIFKAQHKTQSNTSTLTPATHFIHPLNNPNPPQPSISSVTRMQISENARLVNPTAVNYQSRPPLIEPKIGVVHSLCARPVFKRDQWSFFSSQIPSF